MTARRNSRPLGGSKELTWGQGGDGFPSAYELAMLASEYGGDLQAAEKAWRLAANYLDEWRDRLTTDNPTGEQLDRLVDSLVEPEIDKLIESMCEADRKLCKLYRDPKKDEVKDAISAATKRPCGFKVARDHLRHVWMAMKQAEKAGEDEEWEGELRQAKAAGKPLPSRPVSIPTTWAQWCDQHGESDKRGKYLSVPGWLVREAVAVAGLRPSPKPIPSKAVKPSRKAVVKRGGDDGSTKP